VPDSTTHATIPAAASSTTTAAMAASALSPGRPTHTPVAAVPSTVANDTQPVYSASGPRNAARSTRSAAGSRDSRPNTTASTTSSATSTSSASRISLLPNKTIHSGLNTADAAAHQPVRRWISRPRWAGRSW